MNLNKLFNDENKTRLLGLLTIATLLWIVLYFIPEIVVSLFNSLLGNLILILTILLIYMNNRIYGLLIGLIVILLYRFYQLSKEGFTTDSQQKFLSIQNTINKNTIFDMNVIETQASQEELNYFNSNGMWPWSQNVIDLYEDAVKKNYYVRTIPEMSTNYTRTIYNEASILRILSYQTDEGDFLLNGVLVKNPFGNKKEELPNGFGDFVYKSGLKENREDSIIKCNMKNETNPTLEKITYTGNGKKFNEQTYISENIDYNNLENIIPGFTFSNSPCNPCGSIAAIPDYSCEYNLKLKNKSDISSVWKYLWSRF